MNDISTAVITKITEIWNVKVNKDETNSINCRKAYGLTFCEKGRLVYTHEGRDYISDPMHVLILPKGQSYTLRGIESGMFPVINFDTASDLYDCRFHQFLNENPYNLMNSFNQIQRLFLFRNSVSNLKMMSILYDMFSSLVTNDAFASEYRRIFPAVSYMEEHISDSLLSVEKLAEICNMSISCFRKVFESVYGIPPRRYIQEIRINKARSLLNGSYESVSMVSESCGFTSVNHFCRLFRQLVGCTAREYNAQCGWNGL